MDRRSFLRVAGAGAGTLVVATSLPAAAAPPAKPYFQHGVASGDPLPDRVVLWTRVSPTAASFPGSGAGPVVDVRWQVAADSAFRRVVSSGAAPTGPDADHTVKVDAGGLSPATWYWFRFVLDGVRSPVGRTRTAPALDAAGASLRLGMVSCANYEGGFFSPYRHLAARTDLHAVCTSATTSTSTPPANTDPDLRSGAHTSQRERWSASPTTGSATRCTRPTLTCRPCTPASRSSSPGTTTRRRTTPGRPARRTTRAPPRGRTPSARLRPDGPTTSGCRSAHPTTRRSSGASSSAAWPTSPCWTCGNTAPSRSTRRPPALSTTPARTITGRAQMDFLKAGLVSSSAQWKLVGNPVMISPVVFPPQPAAIGRSLADITGLLPPDGVPYNYDQWDGYTADRRELLTHLHDRRVQNTVFLTGDIHSAWACDVPLDAGTYPVSPSVATELVCTSVTSDNLDEITGSPPRTTSLPVESGIRSANRHVQALEFDSHGYSVLDVRPDRVQMDWFYVSERTDPVATSRFASAVTVPAGTSRVTAARSPVT